MADLFEQNVPHIQGVSNWKCAVGYLVALLSLSFYLFTVPLGLSAEANILSAPCVIGPGSTNAPGPETESTTVHLVWSPVTNATSYRIFISDKTAPTSEVHTAAREITDFLFELIGGHEYHWNVRSVSGITTSEPSLTFFFRAKLSPIYPKITDVSPNPAHAVNEAQVFTVHGSDFQRGCEVVLHGKRHGEVYRNREQKYRRNDYVTIMPKFSNARGYWSVEVINPGGFSSGEFPFQVVPIENIPAWRWWRSGWPWACGGFAVFLITGFRWWRTARCLLPRSLVQMRQQTQREERDRLVCDLHDRASADIAHLAQLADEALFQSTELSPETEIRIRELHSAARDAETAIGDLLWIADPQSERLPQLAARLRVRIRERLQFHGIEPDFSQWPVPVPNFPISAATSGQALHLCHEVLNNVIKHARATKFISTLVVEEGSLLLGFRDNGQGFQPHSQPAGRRGLTNMRKRLQDLGGLFQLQSAPGEGTTVTVRLPLERDQAAVV